MHVYLSLIFMITGIALATYGDYYFTMIGFTLTMSGVVLSAVKVRYQAGGPYRYEKWLTMFPDSRYEFFDDRLFEATST